MLVSHTNKFIYLKTRKTASTTIEGALERFCAPPGHKIEHYRPFLSTEYGVIAARAGGGKSDDLLWAHSSAQAVKDYLGAGTFRRYEKIYAVRNPFDKVVSWFWHVMPKHVREGLEDDFDQAQWLFRRWILMRPQLPTDLQFYRVRAGKFKAFVIRYETMTDDLSRLFESWGETFDPAGLHDWKTQQRRHKGIPLSEYYDDDAISQVRNQFKSDFESFGYSMDVPS
ncbi:sulfotransferase family 2 domain-containing protein [Pseudoruegeria sp. HB172150]|uniref:sulfotransferase family 2 domain-containing protein n=1 Tax=Pseudoruegeria sp. HB172150 TaxID=2721164 RepID=UPI001557EB55|nr:sulfotransferase family 2 domain-containing protein [Pseudoruegeria sp. HB172150]